MADTWPFPADTPETRARRVALAYREHLKTANPQVCAVLDETMRAYNQNWLFSTVELHEETDLLSPAQAAEILCISVGAVRQLRIRGRLRGIETQYGWRYLVADLRGIAPVRLGRPSMEKVAKTPA